MKNHIDRQFNRVYISARDIDRCISFLEVARKISDTNDTDILRSLITSAIISYARPFSNNENHHRAVPNPPFSRQALSIFQYELHEKIIKIRNKAVAHSDAELNPVKATEYRENGFLVSSRLYDPIDELSSVNEFLELAREMQHIFENKLFELSRAAFHANQ